jgi:hypothetical protein
MPRCFISRAKQGLYRPTSAFAIAAGILLYAPNAAFAQPTGDDADAKDKDAVPNPADADAGAAPPAEEKEPKKKSKIDVLPIVDAEPPLSSLPAKREVPDYDGRGEEPTTVGDVLEWIPRVLLTPLYLISEYLIRRPIGAVIIAIERDKLAQRAIYIFTIGGKKDIGFFPTFFYDFNLLPSVGVYFWLDDAIVKKNHMRFHVGTWGPEWLNVTARDRYDLSEHSTVSLRAAFSRRRDNLFFGLGPDAKTEDESRFEAITFDVNANYDLDVVPGIRLATTTGVRDVGFNEGSCCLSPTLHSRIRAGLTPSPPRLEDGYTIVYQSAVAALDTRLTKEPANKTGIRLALSGQPAFDTSHRPGNSWVKYDATAGAFLDLTGSSRVISLSASTIFVDPIQGAGSQIPFTEQVSLGGFGLMRGYLPNRLIDRSAAVATLGYQWPIWAFLDGTIQTSVGNVFGAGLRDFSPGKLRLSTGLGVRSNSSPDQQFEVLAGFGTTTFDDGAAPTSLRLAIGATRGF